MPSPIRRRCHTVMRCWGHDDTPPATRRRAYEIDHRSEDSYIPVEATAEPAVMAELDRSLRLADDVLRHKVIRLPERKAGRGGRQSSIAARPAAAQQQNVNGA